MTDAPDFGKCQMVRRIDAGEALELLDDKIEKPDEGGMRRRFRACRDGREGWITTHGSQGTVYTKAATRHYVIQKEAPVHAGLSAESPVVRVLMPGEAFAAFEDPKEVSGGEQLTFYKVRAVTDGAEGWVTSGIDKEVRPWSASYKVLRSVPLTRTLSANEAAEVQEIVRTLEQNEILHAAEHPIEDSSTGQLRLRVVATSDKAPGWATVREGTALLLRPATADEVQAAAKTVAAADDVAPPHLPPHPQDHRSDQLQHPCKSKKNIQGTLLRRSGKRAPARVRESGEVLEWARFHRAVGGFHEAWHHSSRTNISNRTLFHFMYRSRIVRFIALQAFGSARV